MKKRILCALLALMLAAFTAAGLAQEEGAVVRTSCSIVQSGDYYLVYCFAQVHNNSDSVICLDEGSFSLTNGDQLLAESDVDQLWPYFLSPGEDGYLFDIVPFEPNEDGVVVPSVTGISYDLDYMAVDAAHANYTLQAGASIQTDAMSGAMMVICEVTNETQMDAYDPTIAVALYTPGGDLLYTDGMTLQNIGIPAGETIFVRFYVDNVFVRQWEDYGAMPGSAQVNASFRIDED